MKIFKRFSSCLLAFAMICACAPASAFATTDIEISKIQSTDITDYPNLSAASGITGDCNWSVTGETLFITGNGNVADYDTCGPWAKDIESIFIGEGVEFIGNYAFAGLTDLTKVIIADSVMGIGNGVFCGCDSLTSVVLPCHLLVIGDGAFSGCTSLYDVIVPAGTQVICQNAFCDCGQLQSITLPASVTTVGKGAFDGCYSLETVFYGGTETTKSELSIGSDNVCLENASWSFADCVNSGHMFTSVSYSRCCACGYVPDTEQLDVYWNKTRMFNTVTK